MSSIRSAATLLNGICAFFLRSHFRVQGDSMLPAFRNGDLLHVVPRSWTPGGYPRGAVVIAESPATSGEFWVKRVVGLPGELVAPGDSGKVLINDVPLPEPYLSPSPSSPERTPPWLCDHEEYFLMGDNRSDSFDSRRYGPVPFHAIIGHVWLRWPPRRVAPAPGQPR